MKVFGITFLLFLLSLIFSFTVLAQEMSPTPTAEQVSYELPYPGILPDSPLYVFKVLRDKIVEFLISDPLTKANFDLLQADKRLSASLYLQKFSPQKQDLIVSTISKAENYFDDSFSQVDLAKKQGIDTTEMLGKLSISSKKHMQVVQAMEPLLSAKYRGAIDAEEKRITEFEIKADEELIKK